MKYKGMNRGLNSNPEDLHVYSNMNVMGNTTPAGVGQSLFILYFYKHAMPLASVFPLISVKEKEAKKKLMNDKLKI
jgi:hypothetical protein